MYSQHYGTGLNINNTLVANNSSNLESLEYFAIIAAIILFLIIETLSKSFFFYLEPYLSAAIFFYIFLVVEFVLLNRDISIYHIKHNIFFSRSKQKKDQIYKRRYFFLSGRLLSGPTNKNIFFAASRIL